MCSETLHLGGKMTKSAIATPGFVLWHVRTVKIDGSCSMNDRILKEFQYNAKTSDKHNVVSKVIKIF